MAAGPVKRSRGSVADVEAKILRRAGSSCHSLAAVLLHSCSATRFFHEGTVASEIQPNFGLPVVPHRHEALSQCLSLERSRVDITLLRSSWLPGRCLS